MEEIDKLISIIRDSELVEMRFRFKLENSVIELDLQKENTSFKISLNGIRQVAIIDETIQQECIGQIKGKKIDSNNYWISLDPYDEKNETIEERDNYVFKFSNFEIL